ncbi:capsule assembly Wzi family protein [Labilibaculum sp. DW002]|uniref:Capsule assembly Wzi family protein n=1 Tax=Paralabilibaculum antarcticum TaxID=2912572 RepID=A0ABT5VP52_9BACT|nr:capsule assembly Wzi family protein [Labilibaculum sp. DW002]MDE5417217.1 capsule assembly Wzi family protein [Labilibaculum sp. DW002]
MKFKSLLLILLFAFTGLLNAQKKVKYEVGLSSTIAAKGEVPFWLHSNKRGLVPNKSYVMSDFSLGMDFSKKPKTAVDFMWQASAVAYTGNESKLILDNLYLSAKWKIFQFSLGQKADAIAFDGLSSSNGNMLYSNNARSYPKYEISVPEWTAIPFTKGIISFKGLLSDGITTDNRYIDNALVHHKNLFVRLFKDNKFSISGGIEQYAMWAGTHPISGKISHSLDKYFNVFTGSGDDDATFTNDTYRLGNHIGSYHLNAYYNTKQFNLQAYYRSIFEDGSGRKSENAPDGLYGLYYQNKKGENPFIQSALVEFYHTTDQSGRFRGEFEGKHYRGNDNYFNHKEYESGWTHYGKTIGSPLFTNREEYGHAVVINNRFKAIHLGVGGFIASVIPYKSYFTFSKNYGTNANPLTSDDSGLNQFSGLVELRIPSKKIPFHIDLACAVDQGDLLKDNIGFYIRLSKAGLLNK